MLQLSKGPACYERGEIEIAPACCQRQVCRLLNRPIPELQGVHLKANFNTESARGKKLREREYTVTRRMVGVDNAPL